MSILAEVVLIEDIQVHPQADRLEILVIRGWNVIEKKGRFLKNQLCIFFPIDSILPVELSDRLNCTQYLTKQRVKPKRLRGIVSCGLVAPNEGNWKIGDDLTSHYGITKYEPPEPGNNSGMGGENIKEIDLFHHYTNIENWNNWPDVLIPDEEVVINCKIHGSNVRFGLINDEFYVGSHHKVKSKDEKIIYWEMALKYQIEEKMRYQLSNNCNWILFCEVFGKSVQDLFYGLDCRELRLFDISENGNYLNYDRFEDLAKELDLPIAPVLYRGPYNYKLLSILAEGKSFQGNHVKEGCVIRTFPERWHNKLHRVILKKINPDYLVRRGGTEHH